MKILQFFKDDKEILGSDGIMYVDGRYNWRSIVMAAHERNKKYKKNFPHKVADQFAIYTKHIGSPLHSKTKL